MRESFPVEISKDANLGAVFTYGAMDIQGLLHVNNDEVFIAISCPRELPSWEF